MGKNHYSDEEIVSMFMHTFHMMSEREYWKRLIAFSSLLDQLGTFNVQIDHDTGRVRTDVVIVKDEDVTLAAAHTRQFIVNSDPVRLDNVFKSLERLNVRSKLIADAKDQWEQLLSKRLSFRTVDGEAVGVVLLDKYITWSNPGPARDQTDKFEVSLQDFVDTMLHEGLFHPFQPGVKGVKIEAYRQVVRTVPDAWRDRFVNGALASAVFAATMLHDQIGRLDSRWACTGKCAERVRMDARWAQHGGNLREN